MHAPDFNFEPAVRDPKKLRNTALILVGVMLLGGWLVLKAYEKWSVSQSGDNRPAVIYRITKERDLRILQHALKLQSSNLFHSFSIRCQLKNYRKLCEKQR